MGAFSRQYSAFRHSRFAGAALSEKVVSATPDCEGNAGIGGSTPSLATIEI
jgi:hypothetical protein